jgi:hypothetical protein
LSHWHRKRQNSKNKNIGLKVLLHLIPILDNVYNRGMARLVPNILLAEKNFNIKGFIKNQENTI